MGIYKLYNSLICNGENPTTEHISRACHLSVRKTRKSHLTTNGNVNTVFLAEKSTVLCSGARCTLEISSWDFVVRCFWKLLHISNLREREAESCVKFFQFVRKERKWFQHRGGRSSLARMLFLHNYYFYQSIILVLKHRVDFALSCRQWSDYPFKEILSDVASQVTWTCIRHLEIFLPGYKRPAL